MSASSGIYLLGIDSGTSVVKSVIFDLRGREIAIARRSVPVINRVPNGSEVDMRGLWALTAETIREVLEQVPAEQIAAVGISGTACGVWPVSGDGQPLREAILWNDGRAAGIVDEWRGSGFFSSSFQISGNAPFPGYPLSALRWMTLHEPSILERAQALVFNKDWLRFCLTGDLYTDESDMSYFPGDLRTRDYSPALLEGAGIAHITGKLPPAVPSTQIVGTVTDMAAAQTGLREGTPVAAGAVDVVSSLIGGGVYRAGQACSVLGTSFLNTLVSDAPSFDPPDVGVQACMPEGRYARSLVNTSGTLSMDWMLKTLAADEVQSARESGADVFVRIEAAVRDVPIGARGLVFLPYLNTAGIISPFALPSARGLFFGLSIEHGRAEMMRAVYEGTALAMKDCFAVMNQPVEETVLVGGGARSAFWAQMFADATGKRILVPEGSEFGARGAAILAAVGAGLFDGLAAAIGAMVRVAHLYTPDAARAAVYEQLYELYRHLYLNAREAWELRARFVASSS